MRKFLHIARGARNRHAFTLLEVLLATATLAIGAAAVMSVHMAGIEALDDESDQGQRQGHLRSTMEEILSTPFASIALGGFKMVPIGSSSKLLVWSATPTDINGDSTLDYDAKLVSATVDGETIWMILVDHQDKVKKL